MLGWVPNASLLIIRLLIIDHNFRDILNLSEIGDIVLLHGC